MTTLVNNICPFCIYTFQFTSILRVNHYLERLGIAIGCPGMRMPCFLIISTSASLPVKPPPPVPPVPPPPRRDLLRLFSRWEWGTYFSPGTTKSKHLACLDTSEFYKVMHAS